MNRLADLGEVTNITYPGYEEREEVVIGEAFLSHDLLERRQYHLHIATTLFYKVGKLL